MTMTLLITGRIDRSTVERALYHGWTIPLWVEGRDRNVGLATPDDTVTSGFGPKPQADRLRSFGMVSVIESPTTDDIVEAAQRAGM